MQEVVHVILYHNNSSSVLSHLCVNGLKKDTELRKGKSKYSVASQELFQQYPFFSTSQKDTMRPCRVSVDGCASWLSCYSCGGSHRDVQVAASPFIYTHDTSAHSHTLLRLRWKGNWDHVLKWWCSCSVQTRLFNHTENDWALCI